MVKLMKLLELLQKMLSFKPIYLIVMLDHLILMMMLDIILRFRYTISEKPGIC